MVVEALEGTLIVSCQAHGEHPLRDASTIAALAECAELGGARGIRADGPEDVAKIKRRVSLPVIGIYKVALRQRFFITPALEHARALAGAGADLVALEATFENRPYERELKEIMQGVQEELGVPVMADVSNFEEGIRAWKLGADLVATTLSGHTVESRDRKLPDLDLVERLAEAGTRVVCEGGVQTPGEVEDALGRGAWSVVVGTSITDPLAITSRFAPKSGKGGEV